MDSDIVWCGKHVKIYVDEDGRRKGLPSHMKLRYNDEYVKYHGQQPMYGNILIVDKKKS